MMNAVEFRAGSIWRASWLPLAVGLTIGTVLGVMNLIETARRPLADDDAGGMLMWLLGVLVVWMAAAVTATWRTHRRRDAIIAGAILGAATTLVFHAAAIARVNLFLETIQYRDDWRNLVARYQQSGYSSLREYANYEYLRLSPALIAAGAVVGSISGAIGGAAKKLFQGI